MQVRVQPDWASWQRRDWLLGRKFGHYLLVIAGLGVAFSNTALALKVSFWDPSTGKDSSISVDVVKGRSKGVVGASRGLSIAN